MSTRVVPVAITALFSLLHARNAFAGGSVHGTASGTLMYYENEGNYCPTSRNCTGATYLQSQYNTNRGIPNIKVYLVNQYNIIIGQGTTDASGNYSLSWTSGVDPLGDGIWARCRIRNEHKDGRFTIKDSSGNVQSFSCGSSIGLTPNGNTTMGTAVFGTSSLPNCYLNAYAGAARAWDSLSTSNLMLSQFTNQDILAFSNTPCPTSCTIPGGGAIYLDTAAAFNPQARVMHEMGHAAIYKAHPWSFNTTNYDIYNYGNDPGWGLTTQEYDSVVFEEGLATFFGDAAMYLANAVAPRTCNSASVCDLDVGSSLGAMECGTCPSGHDRMPLSMARAARDVYDSTASDGDQSYRDTDCVTPANESVSQPIYAFLDVLNTWPNGTTDGHSEETCCTTACTSTCNPNGRSSVDYEALWPIGIDFGLARRNNCSTGTHSN